jgi:hypothetical protein
MPIQDSDNLIVGRGSDTYKIEYSNLKGEINSGADLQAVTDNGNTTTNGATFAGGNISLNSNASVKLQFPTPDTSGSAFSIKKNTTNNATDFLFAIRQNGDIAGGGQPLIAAADYDPKFEIKAVDGSASFSGDVQINTGGLGSLTGANSNFLKFRAAQTNGQGAILGTIGTQGQNNWGGDLVFSTKPANGSPGSQVTERLRIESSGRLLVGTNSARANYYGSNYTASLQVEGTSFNTSTISATTNSTGDFAVLALNRSKGTTVGSNTIVASGDVVGSVEFQGNDGTNFVQAARIRTEVDGTPGANDMPGRLVFETTASGASSPTERMRIDSAGDITATGSATFGGDVYVGEFDTSQNNVGGLRLQPGIVKIQRPSTTANTASAFESWYGTNLTAKITTGGVVTAKGYSFANLQEL